MDLQQLQAEHLRKYMDMKRHPESFLNGITEEKEMKDDISLTRKITEQTQSSLSSNHVQTSQSVQPNQQSQLGFNHFIQHRVAETNTYASVRCFPIGNNLHSEVNALITPLLNSTSNQLAPVVKRFTPVNPYHSKDWYQSFPQDLRRLFIQRLVKEMAPSLDLFKCSRINYYLRHCGRYEGRMYEAANSKEEYYQLFAKKIFALPKNRAESKRKEMEEKKESPKLEPIPLTNPKKWEDISKKNRHFRMQLLLKKETILLHHLRETFEKEELNHPKNPSLSEEQVKNIQASKEKLERQIEIVSSHIRQMQKMLAESSIFCKQNPHFPTKQTASEVADSSRNWDRFEERRHFVREEVSANRRNNQLKAANLNRGLVMDVDNQASKRDSTFDLTTLDEALPSVSNCKRAQKMTRTLKLQDIVMNKMKENVSKKLNLFEEALIFGYHQIQRISPQQKKTADNFQMV